MRISDWSSDVCSFDLRLQAQAAVGTGHHGGAPAEIPDVAAVPSHDQLLSGAAVMPGGVGRRRTRSATWHPQPTVRGSPCPAGSSSRTRRGAGRSEEHTSELQSLMRISYAVFCLKKKTQLGMTLTDSQYKH